MPRVPTGRVLHVDSPLDLPLGLRSLKLLPQDPGWRLRGAEALWARHTPDGPGTVYLRQDGARCVVQAFGPGAAWCLAQAPLLIGLEDTTAAEFDPAHEPVRALHRRHRGLRFGRTGTVYESLVAAILAQKVHSEAAGRSLRALCSRYGDPAPGPGGLRLLPPAERLARLPLPAFVALGIEERRATTLKLAASRMRRLEEIAGFDAAPAHARLVLLPGIGEWTAAKVLERTHGDCDAVAVGDYHLPSLVSWNLAGEPRADDRRMLELLSPYAGHRARVLRLLAHAGDPAPRYGPRSELRVFY